MTREMIKAIRMVNGINPDLRIKADNVNKTAIYEFLREHRIAIFGSKYAVVPDPATKDFDKFDRMINAAVYSVIEGKGD